MRWTVRGLMASTMPSATAWRARSVLVQCVIWSPSATGSKQASSTIGARWRGGNLLRMSDPRVIPQKVVQATLLVTATDPPDGGPVTLHPGSDRLNRFARGDRQHVP